MVFRGYRFDTAGPPLLFVQASTQACYLTYVAVEKDDAKDDIFLVVVVVVNDN